MGSGGEGKVGHGHWGRTCWGEHWVLLWKPIWQQIIFKKKEKKRSLWTLSLSHTPYGVIVSPRASTVWRIHYLHKFDLMILGPVKEHVLHCWWVQMGTLYGNQFGNGCKNERMCTPLNLDLHLSLQANSCTWRMAYSEAIVAAPFTLQKIGKKHSSLSGETG